jgi:hypothetical protein
MKPFHIAVAVATLVLAGAAFAQAPADNSRGAADGSRPSDGAIKGGSILPGETGGMPNAGAAERGKRCNELSGTLRDECLLKEQESSTGATKAPDAGGAKTTPPRDAPPPQNPR